MVKYHKMSSLIQFTFHDNAIFCLFLLKVSSHELDRNAMLKGII